MYNIVCCHSRAMGPVDDYYLSAVGDWLTAIVDHRAVDCCCQRCSDHACRRHQWRIKIYMTRDQNAGICPEKFGEISKKKMFYSNAPKNMSKLE